MPQHKSVPQIKATINQADNNETVADEYAVEVFLRLLVVNILAKILFRTQTIFFFFL